MKARGLSRPRRRGKQTAALVLALLAVLAACSGGGDSEPPDFATDFSAVGALKEISSVDLQPDGFTLVAAADLSAVAELAGVERPVGVVEAPAEWFSLIFEGSLTRDSPSVVAVPRSELLTAGHSDPVSFETELGWSAADIDSFVSVSRPNEPMPYDIVTMRTDLAALASLAGEDGIIDIGDGEDLERSIKDRTSLRLLGEPWRVGIDVERSMIAVSRVTPPVAGWLSGDGGTWADIEPLAAAAAGLDRDEALYSILIQLSDFELTSLSDDVRGDRPDSDFLIVERFTALGYGWSGIGDSQRTTIVYVFDDDDAAAASVAPIERLYAPDAVRAETISMSAVFIVDRVEAAGRVVIVRGAAAPSVAPRLITRRLTDDWADPLFHHR